MRLPCGRAKVRTGGLTAKVFPSSGDLAQFLHLCAAAGAPFKATAGLHHPICSVHPLSPPVLGVGGRKDADSPKAMMHGFLNVFLAAAFVHTGMSVEQATQLLEENSPEAFRFDEDGVTWRTHRLGVDQLLTARQDFAIAFGACSFEEPIADLKAIHPDFGISLRSTCYD